MQHDPTCDWVKRPVGRGGARVARIAACTSIAALCIALHPTRAATIEDPVGYALGRCAGTGADAQSKLWFHDGGYWAILDGDDGNRIHELIAGRWHRHGSADARLGCAGARADVLWNGSRLVAALHDADSTQLFEFTYDAASRVWSRAPGFPVPLPLRAASRTLVIDEDSRGRLWIVYTAGRSIWVAHSESDHRTWHLPGRVLQDSLARHDIGSLIAFGGSRIGVFWSDQNREEYGFRFRRDEDPTDVWSAPEIVFAGPDRADDHVNLATDRAGRVYAVTKDAAHRLNVHVRRPNGGWISHADVLDDGHGTRAILMAADSDDLLFLLYTRLHEGQEIISCRASPLGETLRFSDARPFIAVPGVDLNDVTGSKGSLPAGSLAAVAYGRKMAWWNGWGSPLDCARLRAHELRVCADASLALDFDEAAGHRVVDRSLHGAVGRLGGPWAGDLSEPAWIDGVTGSALRFDGTRDFVVVPDVPHLEIPGSFTVEAWIRRASSATRDVVLCKGRPGRRNYQISLMEADQVEFLREVQGGRNRVVTSATAIRDSLWHHVACVFDAEAGESRVYIDGRLDAAAPDSGFSATDPAPFCIGMRESEKEFRDWFHGDIDQVRVTAAARYRADFEPERAFAPSGPARVFLSWTPRYRWPADQPACDVLRSAAGGAFRRVNASALVDAVFTDDAVESGTITYRVQPVHAVDKACESALTIEWTPGGK